MTGVHLCFAYLVAAEKYKLLTPEGEKVHPPLNMKRIRVQYCILILFRTSRIWASLYFSLPSSLLVFQTFVSGRRSRTLFALVCSTNCTNVNPTIIESLIVPPPYSYTYTYNEWRNTSQVFAFQHFLLNAKAVSGSCRPYAVQALASHHYVNIHSLDPQSLVGESSS